MKIFALLKSRVKEHLRHNASGATSVVHEHEDSRAAAIQEAHKRLDEKYKAAKKQMTSPGEISSEKIGNLFAAKSGRMYLSLRQGQYGFTKDASKAVLFSTGVKAKDAVNAHLSRQGVKKSLPELIKSRVAAHVRHEHSGKLTLVKEYTDTRAKKTAEVQKPQAKVVKLPNLQETAGKLAVTHRMAKFREPQILDNPVIEHKPGAESVAHIIQEKHVVRKTSPKGGLKPGAEIKYKREGTDLYVRRGIFIKETPNSFFVAPKRNSLGQTEVIKLNKKRDTFMTMEQYREKVEPKPKPSTISSEGDRIMARHNLTGEELIRRKKVVEERLGFSEDKIVNHPSFIGPAVKIVSQLAQENGISTAMLAKPTAALWHQAADANYQEMLFHYAQGAIKAWRRELAHPIFDGEGKRMVDADQTENNVKEFKGVLAGERHSSYTHFVMEKEGKSAAIGWLKEWRDRRNMMHDMDFHDMAEDPEARRLLDGRSSAPLQLKYTLHVNQETLKDDIQKVVQKLDPVEQAVIQMKYGMGKFKEPLENNSQVADHLNKMGSRDPDGNKWTRNSVGTLVRGTINKLASTAVKDELSYHMDEHLGRPVWKSIAGEFVAELCKSLMDFEEGESFEKSVDEGLDTPLTRIPKEFHPAGLFKAGEVEYEVVHEGDEAVLVKGGSFDELFDLAEESLLIKAAGEELAEALEKSHVKEHLRHYADGSVAVVRAHDDARALHGKQGAFYHSETNKRFDYHPTENPWHKEQGATHEIEVKDGTRGAIVHKTVAHVIIDEDDQGRAVWEKWPLKGHNVYN